MKSFTRQLMLNTMLALEGRSCVHGTSRRRELNQFSVLRDSRTVRHLDAGNRITGLQGVSKTLGISLQVISAN